MLFRSGADDTNCIINIVVNGGKIITANGSTVWAEWGDNGSSVTFEKGDSGKLITLVLTDGTTIANGITSSAGELAFVSAGTSEEGTVFVPISKALAQITFVPMASITLDRDLILNVYVPVTDKLTALTFAGEAADLAALEIVEINGSEYYVIRTPLAASAAAGRFLNSGQVL